MSECVCVCACAHCYIRSSYYPTRRSWPVAIAMVNLGCSGNCVDCSKMKQTDISPNILGQEIQVNLDTSIQQALNLELPNS